MSPFRLLLSTIVLLSLLATAQPASPPGSKRSLERTFASGGNIQLRLGADDYNIVPTSDDRISVSWDAGKDRDGRVHVAIDTSGSLATVRTSFPSEFRNRPDLTIQIPSRSNLNIRVLAGDVTVGQVEGNLDVELHAGDLHVDVLAPDHFATVDASTRIGDLTPGPFKAPQKGWLGHSMTWQGSGKYYLHAHVGTGDLVIAAAQTAK